MFTNDVYLVNKYNNNYFEGWYSKVDNGQEVFTVIFGFNKNPQKDQAFIQVFNTIEFKMHYFEFEMNQCEIAKDKLSVKIGDNILMETGMKINLVNQEISLIMDLEFSNIQVYEPKLFHPNIMGPVTYLPKVECRHSLISMHHQVHGKIEYNGDKYKVDAIGYMEKDFGISMPKWWVWSHMSDNESSFMISIAKVKYLKHQFDGNLGFFYLNGQKYIFATYSKLKIKELVQKEDYIYIHAKNKEIEFKLKIVQKGFVVLKAPVNGVMNRDINEAIDGHATLEFTDLKKNETYQKEYFNAAIEIVGDVAWKKEK